MGQQGDNRVRCEHGGRREEIIRRGQLGRTVKVQESFIYQSEGNDQEEQRGLRVLEEESEGQQRREGCARLLFGVGRDRC